MEHTADPFTAIGVDRELRYDIAASELALARLRIIFVVDAGRAHALIDGGPVLRKSQRPFCRAEQVDVTSSHSTRFLRLAQGVFPVSRRIGAIDVRDPGRGLGTGAEVESSDTPARPTVASSAAQRENRRWSIRSSRTTRIVSEVPDNSRRVDIGLH